MSFKKKQMSVEAQSSARRCALVRPRPEAMAYEAFFSISCGLRSSAAFIFYFFTLSKDIDDAPAFLGYVIFEQNLFSQSILFSIMCSLRCRRNYDKQQSVVVV